jgi:alkaline phosphatase
MERIVMMIDRRTFLGGWIAAIAVVLMTVGVTAPVQAEGTARNIVLIIGDGCGIAQMQAASLYQHQREDGLFMQTLPHRGMIQTASADDEVTDSAASATAYATGHRVNNGVISMAIPGSGEPLPTILEIVRQRGMRTGLVTNDAITGATPAAFAAHVVSRKLEPQIAQQYLLPTGPDVIMGGRHKRLDNEALVRSGFTVITRPSELQAIPSTAGRVAAMFGEGVFPYRWHEANAGEGKNRYGGVYPELATMTRAALNHLSAAAGEKGFVLIVEAALIDKSGHANYTRGDEDRLRVNIFETLALDAAVKEAVTWASTRGDTLVLVTADHETGGLTVVGRPGADGWPTGTWKHTNHTAADVAIFGIGPGAERIEPVMMNTKVFGLMMRALDGK